MTSELWAWIFLSKSFQTKYEPTPTPNRHVFAFTLFLKIVHIKAPCMSAGKTKILLREMQIGILHNWNFATCSSASGSEMGIARDFLYRF
jgi:hypothetical protein